MGITIGMPAGIGDVLFEHIKLWSVRLEIDAYVICEGWPARTVEFVELLGLPSKYVPITYQSILMDEAIKKCATWGDVRKKTGGQGGILLEANQHLELGRRIEEWMPDLPARWDFPINTTQEHRDKALAKLSPHSEKPMVGISCASYRGAEAWKTWKASEWIDLLKRVLEMGWQPVMMGGSWDDVTEDVAEALGLPCFVGKTHIGTAVEMHKLMKAYIGFSSGLGIMRVCMGLPTIMLWPDHEPDQRPLSTSWAPPAMLEDRTYIARPWAPVASVWPTVRSFLERSA